MPNEVIRSTNRRKGTTNSKPYMHFINEMKIKLLKQLKQVETVLLLTTEIFLKN